MICPVLISSRPRILIRFNDSIAFNEQEALGLCYPIVFVISVLASVSVHSSVDIHFLVFFSL